MKTHFLAFLLLAQSAAVPLARAAPPSAGAPQKEQSIPFDQLGAEAQKQYKGDGIRIIPVKDGAKLNAIMQDLEAEATPEGLWITSTADEDAGKPNRFRVRAVEVGRVRACSACRASVPDATTANPHAATADSQSRPTSSHHLPPTGTVRASKDAALWLRPGLIEQYSVSSDGVRQDFLVTQRPARNGEALRLELDIHGAQAKKAPDGAKLTIKDTGRELAYTRLKVTDATGRELPAEMHVPAPDRLQVLVQDDFAVYPVCIDPTFSDADWVSMNPQIAGADAMVRALVFDGSGNLYVGGSFTVIVNVVANGIARWNGSTWSALGSGMDNWVEALALDSAGNLYAGGWFTTAGGVSANYIAKWNGSAWSALGSGMNNHVEALALEGAGNLYAGGQFNTAGGMNARYIAKWNGSAWSALGSGMNRGVSALAVHGAGLYAGGSFTTAGGKVSAYVARANLAGGVTDADGDGLLDSWELLYWPSTTGHAPLDGDDKDGYEELLELAFGLNPTMSNPGNLPPVTDEGGYLTMTITKQPGVTYEVQTAGTLLSGQPDSFSAASTTVLINNAITLKVRDNFPTSSSARRFIRAQVTAAP